MMTLASVPTTLVAMGPDSVVGQHDPVLIIVAAWTSCIDCMCGVHGRCTTYCQYPTATWLKRSSLRCNIQKYPHLGASWLWFCWLDRAYFYDLSTSRPMRFSIYSSVEACSHHIFIPWLADFRLFKTWQNARGTQFTIGLVNMHSM